MTGIEFLSRANKSDPVGRRAYRKMQDDFLDAGANVVEVDLIRGRAYMLLAPEAVWTPNLASGCPAPGLPRWVILHLVRRRGPWLRPATADLITLRRSIIWHLPIERPR